MDNDIGACSVCYGSNFGVDGKPCPFAPHRIGRESAAPQGSSDVELPPLPNGGEIFSGLFHDYARAAVALNRRPVAEIRDAPIRDIGIVGPVDGTDTPHIGGSYFRVVLSREHEDDALRVYRISKGAAEVLRDELTGYLENDHRRPEVRARTDAAYEAARTSPATSERPAFACQGMEGDGCEGSACEACSGSGRIFVDTQSDQFVAGWYASSAAPATSEPVMPVAPSGAREVDWNALGDELEQVILNWRTPLETEEGDHLGLYDLIGKSERDDFVDHLCGWLVNDLPKLLAATVPAETPTRQPATLTFTLAEAQALVAQFGGEEGDHAVSCVDGVLRAWCVEYPEEGSCELVVETPARSVQEWQSVYDKVLDLYYGCDRHKGPMFMALLDEIKAHLPKPIAEPVVGAQK